MTERYSKLTWAVPVLKKTHSQAALTFIDNWIMPYSIPNFLLTDTGLQLISKILNALYIFLYVKQLTTTENHPNTNGQTTL